MPNLAKTMNYEKKINKITVATEILDEKYMRNT